MIRAVSEWLVVAVVLVAATLAINTLFPRIRGHLAMGVAAALVALSWYAVRRYCGDVDGA
ncbi:hypothetical protein GCM10009037_27220 [Halarchaeum grantii]|uniref:Uncharacterized protein n=1 Tax=Halarchaeum grantii TaxID=1193105 RepID=A0A830FD91_9EURY|nr:hypothetical protein [Halarchaeum grantii]GGL42249.1 hypothetical protein GCM10009037_27220 [Halarchaeum grantii]